MAYFVIPIIALLVHALINMDVFLRKNPLALQRSYRSYRFFLLSTFLFYITDALWGIFSSLNLVIPTYIATVFFFYFIAVTVFSWSRYVANYLESEGIFSKILKYIGWVFVLAVITLLTINFFKPIFFAIEDDGDYQARIVREVFYFVLIGLFALTAIYSLIVAFQKKDKSTTAKSIAIIIFTLMMCLTVAVQIAYPLSPIYSAGLLLGLTIVRIFIGSEERRDVFSALVESQKKAKQQQKELSTAKEMMYVDSLTGAKSRYAYVELEEQVDSLIANNQIKRFAIVVIDLNDLKYVNDKLGHDEGDRYLVESVNLIKAFFPDADLYRFGGDEFVLFIEDNYYDDRHALLEAFNQKALENFANGGPILAAGLADYIPERDNTYRSVFERADERMYIQKEKLKKQGVIDLAKFSKQKNETFEQYTADIIALKAKESTKKINDSRFTFYKAFCYNEALPLIDLLNNSSCDEILEVNVKEDTFKQIYHVDGKYFVPVVEFSYKDLYSFVIDYIVHPDDKEAYITLMNPEGFFERLANNEIPNFDFGHFRYRLQDGEYRYVEQVIITGLENGISEGTFRLYVFDIHNLKTRQLGYAADDRNVISKGRDQVTNLLLEKDFLKKATNLIQDEDKSKWCFISIDIEHFRFFDEWYGRETGDFLLAKIGATLAEAEKSLGGISGYFGKDDFVLLIPYDELKIKELYESLRAIILSFGLSAGFMPALGVALLEKDLALIDAFDRSTIALARAKSDIRNRVCLYDTEMQFLTAKEYGLLNEFMSALKNDEITFYFQPQCRISSKKIVGVETLARWIKKDGTFISPADFIPVLEKYGFVTDLDQYIWEKVCIWIKGRLDKKLPIVPVSVNVSRVDIFSIDIAKVFLDLTAKYQIPHNLIKLEITESAYSENTKKMDELVATLKEEGFMILMDDFGSGYSSLNMLSNIKIDAIKLDAKFISFEGDDFLKGIHILESVVNMAKQIALPIIVEGVENQKQCDFLENMGCRYIQGYFFYSPMPIDKLEKILETEDIIDNRGFVAKLNEQFRIREFLDRNIYSDTMLNNIIGPVAFYSWQGDHTDIVRFNEQFYQVVSVPDFSDRLRDIEQYLHKDDIEIMHNAFKEAMENRLNGSSVRLRFYRTDGSLSNFSMHFYYLGKKEDGERFYGSAIDMTTLTYLKDQVGIFSEYSNDNLVFVQVIDGALRFSVPSHGLSEIFKLSPETLEKEMNDGTSKERFVNEKDFDIFTKLITDSIKDGSGFTHDFDFYDVDKNKVTLHLTFTHVKDKNSSIPYIINSKVVK